MSEPDPALEHLTEQELTDLMALTAFTGDTTDLYFAKRCRDELIRRWQLPKGKGNGDRIMGEGSAIERAILARASVRAPTSLTDDELMRAIVNACDSLNITRVHEVGGKTRTICEEAGLLEIGRAIEARVRAPAVVKTPPSNWADPKNVEET